VRAFVPPRPARRRRVVLVDDHVAVLEMLRQFIGALPGFQVVGSAADSERGLALCAREQPDLVVLDLVLAPVTGLALLPELLAACPLVRILIYSGYLHAATVRLALARGAHGLVEKSAGIGELVRGLEAVSAGRVYFSSGPSEEVRQLVRRARERPAPDAALTDRERAVLRAIASGLSSKEIADRLDLTLHTVGGLRARLRRKTGLRGVAQLSRYAAELGLVEPNLSPPALGGAATGC
jgi:DNA-binding NarL/FixJ family response regulator